MSGNDMEKQRVENCAKSGNYARGVMAYTTAYCGEIFRRYMVPGGRVLELGPAEGIMTNLLYPFFNDYTVVDGATFFVDELKKRYPDIKAYTSLFEEFVPNEVYDNIILGHVLEHVENPVGILRLCSEWLAPNGKILCAVPNANSLHRQAAVEMGLLKYCNELNRTDIENGHRRVYDVQSFRQNFIDVGLSIKKFGGYWLKTLSNAQIDNDWTNEMIAAYLKIGEKYPEIAAEIYVVAEKKMER